jgi:hypothetical protein
MRTDVAIADLRDLRERLEVREKAESERRNHSKRRRLRSQIDALDYAIDVLEDLDAGRLVDAD